MRIALTGADGFLGWHLRCAALARGIAVDPLSREDLARPERLAGRLGAVDAVIHCAGVNRGSDTELTEGNRLAAEQLATAVAATHQAAGQPLRLVYANSIQSLGGPTAGPLYGPAKRLAGERLATASPAYSDVLLPNLFGEHGRPWYNSFVATFCAQLAEGGQPEVTEDRLVPLLHVQDAAAILLDQAGVPAQVGRTRVEPPAQPVPVSRVLALLREFARVYATGELPDIADPFAARLFNTYRSFLVPDRYPIIGTPRTDQRGTLVECVRTGSAGGQAFVSSTRPGAVRGEHFHLRKFERFLVLEGEAEIALRRLFSKDVVRFRVTGGTPAMIDMPTLWVHNLTNIGRTPVTTFFWTNELFDPADPDTFPAAVDDLEVPR